MRFVQLGTYTAAASDGGAGDPSRTLPARCPGGVTHSSPSGRSRQPLPTLRPPRQRPADLQRHTGDLLDRAPTLRGSQSRLFGPLPMLRRPQLLDHLPGVDPQRAGDLAGAVGRAGLQRVVVELLEQRPLHRRALGLARHLPAQDDPLARRRRQVAARADRLAEAALDAGRGPAPLLDRRRRFQVAQVDAGVAAEEDVRREHAVGVGELLHPPHQLGRLLPPLAFDVRGHVDPGPVLGLERAVVLADDQLDQAAHEGLVALEVLLLGEVGGQHEVEVPGRGVAGDAGQEAVLAEQRLQVLGALGDPLRRHADVLDDQRRPLRPHPADQPVQSLAHPPGELDRLRLAGEVDRPDRLVRAEDRFGPEHLGGEVALVGRRRTRPAAPPTPAAALSTPAAPRPCSRRR